MCAFDVSGPYQLAIPRLSASLPTTKCPESNRFIANGLFTYEIEGMCKNHVGFSQEFVDVAFRSACSQSKHWGLYSYFYCENSDDLGYCILLLRNSTILSPVLEHFEQLYLWMSGMFIERKRDIWLLC